MLHTSDSRFRTRGRMSWVAIAALTLAVLSLASWAAASPATAADPCERLTGTPLPSDGDGEPWHPGDLAELEDGSEPFVLTRLHHDVPSHHERLSQSDVPASLAIPFTAPRAIPLRA